MNDEQQIEDWESEGGALGPDEEENEQWRTSLTRLHNWLTTAIGDENNAMLIAKLVTRAITLAEFADALGVNRSSGKRRFDRYKKRLHARLKKRPELLATMPSPWREMYLGE
jgi:hypothetical protein